MHAFYDRQSQLAKDCLIKVKYDIAVLSTCNKRHVIYNFNIFEVKRLIKRILIVFNWKSSFPMLLFFSFFSLIDNRITNH